jgi:hypothetical protein
MKLLISTVFLFISLSLQARVQPEEGLWDNPDAQGRGLTIELQNGVLVATYFGYDQEGNAQWWQGVGFENPESTWSGSFNAFRDGQCNGCQFQESEIDSENDIGNFSISFESTSKAVLSWDGGTENIEKNYYFFNQPLDFIFGAWTLNGFETTYGIATNAAVIRIDEYVTIEGIQYASGNLAGYQDDFPVLVAYLGSVSDEEADLAGERIVINFPISAIEQQLYDVVVNENKLEGFMAQFSQSLQSPPQNLIKRAAGAKYIDLYEKQQLFGSPSKSKPNKKRVDINSLHKTIVKYIENQ